MAENPSGINLETFGGGCAIENGFPYPDWREVSKNIRANLPDAKWGVAFNDVVAQWLEKLAAALGPAYVAGESQNFFYVSSRDTNGRRDLAQTTENYWAKIQKAMRGFLSPKGRGKRVVILTRGLDEYYRYTSRFNSGEKNRLSRGCFISAGYGHIVIPEQEQDVYRRLAHELTHNALFGYPLPLWLDESLAQRLEASLSPVGNACFNSDLADRHFALWTSEAIQGFWSGRSFHEPEKSELSYSLAQILLGLMIQEKWDVAGFVQAAHWRDAGQAAAVKYLGRTLGAVAGIFLGEGDWEPKANEPDKDKSSA